MSKLHHVAVTGDRNWRNFGIVRLALEQPLLDEAQFRCFGLTKGGVASIAHYVASTIGEKRDPLTREVTAVGKNCSEIDDILLPAEDSNGRWVRGAQVRNNERALDSADALICFHNDFENSQRTRFAAGMAVDRDIPVYIVTENGMRRLTGMPKSDFWQRTHGDLGNRPAEPDQAAFVLDDDNVYSLAAVAEDEAYSPSQVAGDLVAATATALATGEHTPDTMARLEQADNALAHARAVDSANPTDG